MNDYSAVDRLVEFGLGAAIATQMVNTMNKSMANMAIPATTYAPGMATTPPAPKPTAGSYALVDSKIAGPFTPDELARLIAAGKVTADTFLWHEGLPEWIRAQDIPEIYKLILLNTAK